MIVANDLWNCPVENVERLAKSIGVRVDDDARAAWGRDWRGKLIASTLAALRADAVRAKQEAEHRRRNGYTAIDSRAR